MDSPVILIAEDRDDDVLLINNSLKRANVTRPIRIVHDGEQAIAYLKGEGKFSDRDEFPLPMLLLLDLKMPRISGVEVLKWIRAQKDLQTLRVIVLDVSTSTTFGTYVTGHQDLDVGNITSRSVSGLTDNTAYYYRVRAYNSSGTSGNSGTIGVTTSLILPPTLAYAKQGSNLVFSWPTNFTGFSLESVTNLPSTNWTSNAASPAVVNGQYTVTNPMPAGKSFFRLKK